MAQLYTRSWGWYLPADRTQHATNLAASMASAPAGAKKQFLLKAGGDGGRAWSQYSAQNCKVYEDRGIDVIPWIYAHPDDSEIEAVIATLRKRWSDEILYNPEVEWSYANGITDDRVRRFIDRTRQRCRAEFGRSPEIGFSSVASWTWFPYAAWSAECDGTEDVQCYWQPHVADQAGPCRRKSRQGARIIVGLPACQREDSGGQGVIWDNARLAALVAHYATGMRDLVGFNGWQSGATGTGRNARTDYGYDAMRGAYSVLERFATPTNPTPQPSPFPHDIADDPNVWHCYLPDGSLDTWVIQPEFLKFWRSIDATVNGTALSLFGLPISGMHPDNDGRLVQYFERARMELHGPHVALGRVGAELLDAQKRGALVSRADSAPLDLVTRVMAGDLAQEG